MSNKLFQIVLIDSPCIYGTGYKILNQPRYLLNIKTRLWSGNFSENMVYQLLPEQTRFIGSICFLIILAIESSNLSHSARICFGSFAPQARFITPRRVDWVAERIRPRNAELMVLRGVSSNRRVDRSRRISRWSTSPSYMQMRYKFSVHLGPLFRYRP